MRTWGMQRTTFSLVSKITAPSLGQVERTARRWPQGLPRVVGVGLLVQIPSVRRRLTTTSRRAQPNLESVLTFWFGPEVLNERERLSDEAYLRGRTKMWYLSGSKHDETARGFVPLLEQEHRAWQQKEEAHRSSATSQSENLDNLARVVLFDQIPRNAFRGTANAFYYDQDAVEVSEELLKAGFANYCSAAELLCLVQPFSHNEHPSDASRIEMSIEMLQKNMPRFPDGASKIIFQAILSHDAHRAVLRRFGRYPHRNELMGRTTTPEEQAWLNSSDCPGWARSQQRRRK